LYIFWRKKLSKKAQIAQQSFNMTNSFGRTSFSGGNSTNALRNSFSGGKEKSNLKSSIIPSSHIFIAMSQGNVSSNSSSEDETVKEDF
jgi:hypothetical protein